MGKIKLVVFDLSGTTVRDDNAVARCLHQSAKKFGINTTIADFQKTIGTNKIKLFEFMIARDSGYQVSIEQFETYQFPAYHERAIEIFNDYSKRMLDYYNNHVREMPGAVETFNWCHQNGIKVATDTGFHADVNTAIMKNLKWLENGFVDFSVNIEDTGGYGRPTPYMIYHAMMNLSIQSIHQVIKIGDTPADLLSGYNAGCIGNIGVLSGANTREYLVKFPHTQIIDSVADLPQVIERSFI